MVCIVSLCILLFRRFKALESKLESTLQKSLSAKDEKIVSLESRLQESVNLNNKLRSDIKVTQLRSARFLLLEPQQCLHQRSSIGVVSFFSVTEWFLL